ncbi:hypothetical protein [Antiquaquibacter soli]|uniref:HTTM domain-containing protein n=1 Tax=Antiquaquibacter soli TaxID=3064523 RepID=A0ABT9BJ05_9MICO|nr:hypothetical protein [Protaetiibacter sp. WY-16]MDO7881013.1 hypothetical protein [Protaetiibacter sp. WY-16]
MSLRERILDWVDESPVGRRDLGAFRILFSIASILLVPDILWVARMPDSAFHPRFGPLMLLPSAPPEAALLALQVALAVALALLALGGPATPAVSYAASALLLTLYGLAYSFGQIDHSIVLAVAPALLAHSGWGRTVTPWPSSGPGAPGPALRALAVAIGLGMAWAALNKVASGWIGGSATALGYSLQSHVEPGDPLRSLAGIATGPLSWIGEGADLVVVVLELGALVTVLWWPAFRLTIALLALFHLAVWIMLDISFAWNVVVYAAFVPWGRVLPTRALLALDRMQGRRLPTAAAVGIGVLAAAASLVASRVPAVEKVTSVVILVIGAATAVALLASATLRRVSARRRAPRPRAPRSAPR